MSLLSTRRAMRALIVATVAVLAMSGGPARAAEPPRAAAQPQSSRGDTGVFAIDQDHHTVVFAPAHGGAVRLATTGLTDPSQITVSRGGSLFVIDGGTLFKVTKYGNRRIIRTGMAANSQMAVDDNNYLFVDDGGQLVKYPPTDGAAPISVGSGVGEMTVDGAGNVSLTAEDPSYDETTTITTYPVRGGKPTIRKPYSPSGGGLEYGYFAGAVEARDGTMYIEIGEPGGSGASDVVRARPGPPGRAPITLADQGFAEYVYNVDAASNFYLVQNRHWCDAVSRDEGDCVDDYGVDTIFRSATAATSPTTIAVQNFNLPVGGISIAATGDIYAAVLVSRSAGPTNSTAVPELERIAPTGGSPVVLAKGHFTQPVAEDFTWYGAGA